VWNNGGLETKLIAKLLLLFAAKNKQPREPLGNFSLHCNMYLCLLPGGLATDFIAPEWRGIHTVRMVLADGFLWVAPIDLARLRAS
jgi:hypothetical protein